MLQWNLWEQFDKQLAPSTDMRRTIQPMVDVPTEFRGGLRPMVGSSNQNAKSYSTIG